MAAGDATSSGFDWGSLQISLIAGIVLALAGVIGRWLWKRRGALGRACRACPAWIGRGWRAVKGRRRRWLEAELRAALDRTGLVVAWSSEQVQAGVVEVTFYPAGTGYFVSDHALYMRLVAERRLPAPNTWRKAPPVPVSRQSNQELLEAIRKLDPQWRDRRLRFFSGGTPKASP